MISLYISQITWLHRLPVASKLIFLALLSVAVFYIQEPVFLLIGCLIAAGMYAGMGRVGLNRLAGLRHLAVLIVAIGLFQVWMMGWHVAALSVLRIFLMVMLADLVTATTPMQAMMHVLLPVLAPLKLIGLNPKKLGLGLALMIRFVPVLGAQWRAQREAWAARSEKKPFLKLLPAFIALSLRRTDQIAESIAARTVTTGHGLSKNPK